MKVVRASTKRFYSSISKWLSIWCMLTHSWRLAIVWELQNMNHVLALLFQDMLPRNVWKVTQGRSESIVIVPKHN